MDKNKILIVGAGGFIGGFIARRALELGYETWVGVRASTSRKYLDDPRLRFVEFDYDDPDAVERVLTEARPEKDGWDYIVWNLGATKCANFADFNRINYLYLRDFVTAMLNVGIKPEKFLFVSSLSALGPGDEKGYKPLDSRTVPNPNTRYGVSKIKAETFLETVSDRLDWIVFRPTGVYGPHEQDYLMMIKSIDRGFDVGVGMRPQMLTFVYVADLVDAMFAALAAPAEKVVHHKYIISEDRAYSQKEFREIVCRHLGRRNALSIRFPLWMLYAVSVVSEKIAAAKGKASTLNRDKFRIMKQRNWRCETSDAKRDFGFTSQWSLDRGIEKTVEEYLKNKK